MNIKNGLNLFYLLTFTAVIISSTLFIIHSKPEINNTTPQLPFNRKSIIGDFNGDSTPDTLTEKYYSRLLKKDIRKLRITTNTSENDVHLYMKNNQPTLSLVASNNNIKTLNLYSNQNHPTFGITEMLNIGNINNTLGDEIAIIVGKLTKSLITTCEIWSYSEQKKWFIINQYTIHEEDVWDNEQQKSVLLLKQKPNKLNRQSGIIFKNNSNLTYLYSYQSDGSRKEHLLTQ